MFIVDNYLMSFMLISLEVSSVYI